MKKQFNEEAKSALTSLVAPLSLDGWFDPEVIDNWHDKVRNYAEVPEWIRAIVWQMIDTSVGDEYYEAHNDKLVSHIDEGHMLFTGFVKSVTHRAFKKDVLGTTRISRACCLTVGLLSDITSFWYSLPASEPEEAAYKPKYDTARLYRDLSSDSKLIDIIESFNFYHVTDNNDTLTWEDLNDEAVSLEEKDEIAEKLCDALQAPSENISDYCYLEQAREHSIRAYINDESEYCNYEPADFILSDEDWSEKYNELIGEWADKYVENNIHPDTYSLEED